MHGKRPIDREQRTESHLNATAIILSFEKQVTSKNNQSFNCNVSSYLRLRLFSFLLGQCRSKIQRVFFILISVFIHLIQCDDNKINFCRMATMTLQNCSAHRQQQQQHRRWWRRRKKPQTKQKTFKAKRCEKRFFRERGPTKRKEKREKKHVNFWRFLTFSFCSIFYELVINDTTADNHWI